jgi:crossover junction endodeoxyribonuclease RusA
MLVLSFTVYGVAQPQGSTKAFMPKGARYPVVTSDNPQLKGWRQLVAEGASAALQGVGMNTDGPVSVEAHFFLPRPKSLGIKTKSHLTRPDIDKLSRALLDALTGVIWRDDSQVVTLLVSKKYACLGESPRVDITVTPGEFFEVRINLKVAEALKWHA